jgi:phosphoribosylamine--glycine ligase / phosphoribosylformylglycinamidine cyclo-ligase
VETGDYDLAGFAVGAVERSLILPRPDICPGDVLLGLPSSGLLSNGFSLVRKVISISGLTFASPCPWNPDTTLGEAILVPTKIYVKQLLPAVQAGLIKGMSHITGGGFTENIPRVLPKGLGCYVDVSQWELPAPFCFLMQHGGIEPLEMARTFNNGVGMVLVVNKTDVDQVVRELSKAGEAVYRIGEVTDRTGVDMRGLDAWASLSRK